MKTELTGVFINIYNSKSEKKAKKVSRLVSLLQKRRKKQKKIKIYAKGKTDMPPKKDVPEPPWDIWGNRGFIGRAVSGVSGGTTLYSYYYYNLPTYLLNQKQYIIRNV